jgi:hypothetical protein
MKSLPIVSLALVLALSGCSSSPSVEDQTKLIEYEKCLAFASDSTLASRKRILDLLTGGSLEDKMKIAIVPEEFISYIEKNLFKRCSTYRP